MRLRTAWHPALRSAAVVALLAFSACGGSPTSPGPTPPPPPPPANSVPVIESITLRGTRQNQPPNFADLSETIDVSATVRDSETAVEQLQYVWSASVGTFSGSGARVTWLAPGQAATPLDVTLRLEVIERYATSSEHRVSSTATLSLHDSVREVGDMARQFLLDFSDSNVGVEAVMRNFDPSCYGTAEEAAQVADNRAAYRINSASVGAAAVTVNFGGICSFRARPGDACAQVPVSWSSTRLSNGSTESVEGTDQVAAVYRPELKRWRLCDSQFDGRLSANMFRFIR